MNASSESEEKIRKLIRSGNLEALAQIYELFGKKFYGYFLSTLRSAHGAEETMQNLFVRIAEKRNHIAHSKNLTAYLFMMARNEAMDYLRHEKKKEKHVVNADEIFTVESGHNPGIAPDEKKEVADAVLSLPLEQREIITLKIFHDMTFEEISKSLKISNNTAASRYRYGMEKLKKSLRRFKDEL